MSIAIYPGSFNPWHKGHEDVLKKALEVFDQVSIVQMENPDKKKKAEGICHQEGILELSGKYERAVFVDSGYVTLKEAVEKEQATAIIRGLRNGDDLQYEMNQQYWNEDVGIKVPFVYFVTDRALSHVSSSAIRSVNKLGLSHEYAALR
jgi:pantetheine-phosphate adenylyltransferase